MSLIGLAPILSSTKNALPAPIHIRSPFYPCRALTLYVVGFLRGSRDKHLYDTPILTGADRFSKRHYPFVRVVLRGRL